MARGRIGITNKFRRLVIKKHLKKYGAKCPNCGMTASIQYYKKTLIPMWLIEKEWKGRHLGYRLFHVDHIIPISKGGKHTTKNCQLLCANCNLKKKNKNA